MAMGKPKAVPAERLDIVDRRLLDILQRDFPLSAQPFATIGERLGLPEGEVLTRVRRLKGPEKGRIIRQISAIFDTTALGYRSTLVAMRVPQDKLEQAAAAINRHPGVSHNYRRDHNWNLWFTLALPPHEDLAAAVEALANKSGSFPYRLLPALAVFKIAAELDMGGTDETFDLDSPHRSSLSPARPLSGRDKAFVRELQEDTELVPRPFAGPARRLGVSEEEVVDWLREAEALGWLRRFAAILHHRRAGYVANGMVAWRVPPERIEEAGAFAASLPQVSHCYQRPTYPDWPYNLFTMIHARSKGNCRAVAAKISCETGIADYVILFSTKGYKKTRLRYFV